jgi:hypothetical protein
MALRKVAAIVWLLAAVNCYAQFQPNNASRATAQKPGFSIVINVPISPITLSGPIDVVITVTNNTNHDIYWVSDRGPDGQYTAFTYDLERNGHEVPTTFFHRKITGKQRPSDPNEVYASSSILLPHPPGTMFKVTINLKRLYHISEPGKYTLQVSRYDQATKTTVRANTLSLNVEP